MQPNSSPTCAAAPSTERPRYLGEQVASVSGEHSDWHSHDFGQLISSVTGSMSVGTSDRVLLLSPAMAMWIPPGALHWMRTSSNNEMLYVDVNRDESLRLGMECRIMSMTPMLSALMTATLPEEIADKTPTHIDTIHDLMRYEVMSARDVPLTLALPKDKRIRALAELALENPTQIVSVEGWLAGSAASRKTIERLFDSETGMPPSRWLRQAKVLHAISQLAEGEKVSTVAFDMGYESLSAFSHMFRQVMGDSPSKFVRKPG